MLEDENKQCFFTTIVELCSVVSCVFCIAVSVQTRSVNEVDFIGSGGYSCGPPPMPIPHIILFPLVLSSILRSSRFLFVTSSTREAVYRLIALKNIEKSNFSIKLTIIFASPLLPPLTKLIFTLLPPSPTPPHPTPEYLHIAEYNQYATVFRSIAYPLLSCKLQKYIRSCEGRLRNRGIKC